MRVTLAGGSEVTVQSQVPSGLLARRVVRLRGLLGRLGALLWLLLLLGIGLWDDIPIEPTC